MRAMGTRPEAEPTRDTPAKGGRPWRRRLLRGAGCGLVLLAIALVSIPLLLRLSSVRSLLLDQVESVVGAGLGFTVTVDDFSLDSRRGRLHATGLELRRAPEHPPFVQVEDAVADFRWRDLLRAPRRIETLTVESLAWHIDAPHPAGRAAETEDAVPDAVPDDVPPLIVESMVIVQGRVESGRPPPGFERWFGAWQWRRVEGSGAYDADGLRLRFEPSPVTLTPVDGGIDPPPDLRLAGAFALPAGGGMTLDDVHLVGEGIDLRGGAEGGFGEGEAFVVKARLDSRPGRILPDVPAASRLEAEADLDVRAMVGSLKVDGELVPADVLRPYLGVLGPELALEGTSVELTADIDLGGPRTTSARGDARLAWRRGEETLLTAETTGLPSDGTDLRLAVDARLLPAVPGSPAVEGTVVIPASRTLGFEDLRARLTTSDLPSLLDSLSGLAPAPIERVRAWLRPETLRLGSFDMGGLESDRHPSRGGRLVADRLEVDARIDGSADAFAFDVDADLRGDPSRLRVAASGRWPVDGGRVEITARNLPLALDASDAGSILSGSVLDEGRLVATLRGRRLSIEEGRLESGGRRVRVVGDIDFDRAVDRLLADLGSVRVASAELVAEATSPVASVERLSGTVGLRQGTLELVADASVIEPRVGVDDADVGARIDGRAARSIAVEGRVPLAGVARWPALDWLAQRVTGLADGRATLSVRAPGFNSAQWLPTSPASLSGDLDLDLDLDPGAPIDGEASLVLADAVVRFGDRRLDATTPVRARLEEGRLVLDETIFVGSPAEAASGDETPAVSGPRISIAGTTELAPGAFSPETAGGLPKVGPLRLSLQTGPGLEWRSLAAMLGVEPGPLDLTGAVSAEIEIDLEDSRAPLGRALLGRLIVQDLEGRFDGDPVTVSPITIELGPMSPDRTDAEAPTGIVLAPTRIRLADQLIEVGASAPIDFGPDAIDRIGPVAVRLTSGPAVLGPESPPFRPARWMTLLDLEVDESSEPIDLEGVVETSLDADLALELRDWPASQGTIRLRELTLGSGARRLIAREDAEITLADRRIRLPTLRLASASLPDVTLEVEAGVDLAESSTSGVGGPIANLDVRVDGTLPSSIFNPALAAIAPGAATRGPFHLDVEVNGAPDALSGRIRVSAPDATIVVARPYAAELSDLRVDATLSEGAFEIAEATAKANRGSLELSGGRAANGDVDIVSIFDGLRLRVDYGLSLALDGRLRYRQSSDIGAKLEGEVVVAQGQLRRNLDLDRALLNRLFAPPSLPATAPEALRGIELDISLRTEQGVRIKNNLADLHATWSEITIRGSLAEPALRGRIDTDPEGYIFAYGQALRVDSGSVIFRGTPGIAPELDFVVTSAADDPSISREGASRFPASLRRSQPTTTGQDLGTGVADYYLSRLAGQLGASLGAFDVSVGKDLLIFGEADPSRRLTVGRDLSSHVALAASFALDEESDSTYVLDLHDFEFAENVVAQVFTTDDEESGATLQHVFELGRPEPELAARRVRGVEVTVPENLKPKAIRRAADVAKGDSVVPEEEAFDIEIDVAEHLRRQGYPGARVDVAFEPAQRPGVMARIAVDPGPPVRFEFEGDRPPGAVRQTIRTIYRPDLDEAVTLREIEAEAVRALRAAGHLEPKVDVSVAVEDPSRPASRRTVIVRADGGKKTPLNAARFEGVSESIRESLETRFDDPLSRARLLRGDDEIVDEIERALVDLALPASRVVSLDRSSDRAVVTIEPGPTLRIARIVVEGIPEATVDALLPKLDIAVGGPARRDRLATAAVRLEGLLVAEGRAAARVALSILSGDGTDVTNAISRADLSSGVTVVLGVSEPTIYRIEDVVFTGRRATRRRWAERAAGLDKGDLILESEIADARRSLYKIGAFQTVIPRTELGDDGTGVVTFDIEERARYRLAYGGRWSTDQGLATIADVVDRNGFGRGVRLGFRARLSDDEESARLFGSVPNVFGTDATLDLFVEGRETEEEPRTTSRVEGTLQVSVPHGERTTSRYYVTLTDQTVTRRSDDGEARRTRDRFPVVGFQWLRDSRSDRIEPVDGSLISLDLSASDGSISGDLSFLRLLAQMSHFRTVGRFRDRPIVWAQSLAVGIADTFGAAPLLRDERFFAGGEFSVRGYPEDSLGPVLPEGIGRPSDRDFAEGGEGLLVVNQEIRFPVTERYQAVLFVDAGNVYLDPADIGRELRYATGIGVRARTPIGLLRGDLAFPLNGRLEDDDFEVYIGFGSSF